MDRQTHISPSRFRGILTEEEQKHLASCPWCQKALADFVEEEALLHAPRHLEASILEKSRSHRVQLIAGAGRLSRNMQMFYYSLKVGTAVLCSLSLLFLASSLNQEAVFEKTQQRETIRYESISDGWQRRYEHIESITGQLDALLHFNREVFRYDKKEK